MVLFGPVCKFVWREPFKARVGPVLIVVVPPCFDVMLGLGIAREEVLVETFIPQAAIEALDKTVLHRLA